MWRVKMVMTVQRVIWAHRAIRVIEGRRVFRASVVSKGLSAQRVSRVFRVRPAMMAMMDKTETMAQQAHRVIRVIEVRKEYKAKEVSRVLTVQ